MQSAQAYTPVFSVGLRGGAQTILPQIKSGDTWSVSNAYTGGGMADFRYAYYTTFAPACMWGFYVGVGAGVSSESLKGTMTDQYTNWDYDDSPMRYTVHSDFRQTTIYARTELSLMLAFYFGPESLNFGPRFVVPFATKQALRHLADGCGVRVRMVSYRQVFHGRSSLCGCKRAPCRKPS